MINVIYGEKGSGKTKQLVAVANEAAENAKGVVVYMDRTNNRMHDLNRNVRLVDVSYYGLCSQRDILTFIKGMLASNYDIEEIFIDGVTRLLDCNVSELAELYAGLEKISADNNINFVITASSAKANLPEFIAKYAK